MTLKFFMTQKIRLSKFCTIGSCGIETRFKRSLQRKKHHQCDFQQTAINQQSMAIFLPVTGQQMHLNSVPKGSGFLRMNDRCGSPPVLVVWGFQALINSSNTFFAAAAIQSCRFLLNPSTRSMSVLGWCTMSQPRNPPSGRVIPSIWNLWGGTSLQTKVYSWVKGKMNDACWISNILAW